MDPYSKGRQDPVHNKDFRSKDIICKGLHKGPKDYHRQVMRTTTVDRASKDPPCEGSEFLEYDKVEFGRDEMVCFLRTKRWEGRMYG